jgi:5-methylcytosine-specific restriction endonuclease McrA
MRRQACRYGATSKPREWQRGPRDKRYGSSRYQRFRLRVLIRDNWTCFVPGCPTKGEVLDHIIPTYPGMPDDLFFSEKNARASCAKHNRARGWQTYAARELGTSC